MSIKKSNTTIKLSQENVETPDVFQTITDWLQDINPRSLAPFHADLAAAWLRKIVASNHITLGRRWIADKRFAMYMLDTSLADQPHGAWVTIKEFLQVVAADGEMATSQIKRGIKDSILRVLFVPNGEYILSCSDYLVEAVTSQASLNITICLSRADCAVQRDGEAIGDGFCIRDQILCEIEKPSWRFTTTTDKSRIRSFVDRVHTIAAADYSVVIRADSLKHIQDFLLELALQ